MEPGSAITALETTIARSQERQREAIPEAAYKKAVAVLQDAEYGRDASAYHHVPASIIQADQTKIKQAHELIRARRAMRDSRYDQAGAVFEALFIEQAGPRGWLGADTTVQPASSYDNLFHGLDAVATWSQAPRWPPLALGIDVTSSSAGLKKKLRLMKEHIDRGQLQTVRYLQTRTRDGKLAYAGSLSHVPKGIIALERATIAELARLWIKHDQEGLARHPVQLQILQELIMQVTTCLNYARDTNRGRLVSPLQTMLQP